MGRHAYLITAYDDYYLLDCLIELLIDPRNDTYVHVDKKSTDFDEGKFLSRWRDASVQLVPRRRVYWGDFTHVKNILELLRFALDRGKYDYLHLLSGSDLPVKSQDFIHDFCTRNTGKEFVAFNHLGAYQEEWIRFAHPFNHQLRAKSKIVRVGSNRLRRAALTAQKRLDVDFRRRIPGEVKYGSDWFSVTAESAALLLAREADITRWFRHAFIPSEFFVQTILWNSGLAGRVFDLDDPYHSSMRLIDFPRGSGSSPHIWTMADADELASTDRLFARKFNSRVDAEIVHRVCAQVRSQS